MSLQLISRSPDLRRLRDEGYDIEVRSNYLLVRNVPYVNSRKEVKLGILVCDLTIAGDATTAPADHVMRFIGEYPCNRDGAEIGQIRNQSGEQRLDSDLVVQHSFSSKPTSGRYADYYEKVTTYAAILSGPAASIDSNYSPRTFPVVETTEDESVFKYLDTASSRAGINLVSRKLELERMAIVGLGGTGSYVLDMVAKTPVKEIHLFDGDRFCNHNAFRCPGAPSIEELRQQPYKVDYFQERYSNMHRHIIAHRMYVDGSNIDQLGGMAFVFLCLDRGTVKRLIMERLEHWGVPFIDVGMGVEQVDDSLLGVLRITTSTREKRDHVWNGGRIPFSDNGANNDYTRNIQICDLNALNAALAVVKWKKLFGFYLDLEKEHFSAYTIDGNALINEDRP